MVLPCALVTCRLYLTAEMDKREACLDEWGPLKTGTVHLGATRVFDTTVSYVEEHDIHAGPVRAAAVADVTDWPLCVSWLITSTNAK